MKIIVFLTLLGGTFFLSDADFNTDGVQLDRGLTQTEKQGLLKEHNRRRSLVARGQVNGQPSAADMTRLEWSDSAAQHAQVWADNCGGPMHGSHKEYGEGQNFVAYSDRNVLIKQGFIGWFDREHPMYRYKSPPGAAGHYTQMVTSYSTKIGCGANKCKGYSMGRLLCNFFIGGNFNGKPPYTEGRACTKCPPGHGYCKDSLCTSSRVCRNNDKNCKCMVDSNRCSKHGNFDRNKCECKCRTGWTGLNCDKPCVDAPNKMCSQRKRTGGCDPGYQFFVDSILHCPGSCGQCELPCNDDNQNCQSWSDRGECQKNPNWMLSNCRKSCRQC